MAKLLDAATTLMGWVNVSAEPHIGERTIAQNTTVLLTTPLDTADTFTFIATHPGHAAAVTFTLEVAPLLIDGSMGSWVQAAQVAIPAAGGRVEAPLNGQLLTVAPADLDDVREGHMLYARVSATVPAPEAGDPPLPANPAGAYAGLTF